MITPTPPTVAVIGCGPSGMFFLHAVALRRAKLSEQGDVEGLAALPIVTCFEKSSGPGGVWRSDRFDKDKDQGDTPSTNMYEALWTNAPKETMEFFDHTFHDHFGRSLPMFLPREHVLDYFSTRCTKNNPKFFNDVKFNTSVETVKYDDESSKFTVKLFDLMTETSSEGKFDYCIHAAGENSTPNIPSSVDDVLKSGGFKGKIMHSSQTDSTFDQHVRGKNIMFVGDSLSAEDLALTAIKLGVETIEVVTRSAEGIVTETGYWPEDKVDINENCIVTGVADDGRGVILSKVEYNSVSEKYDPIPGRKITLDCIDTVIYCTGYLPNYDMLDESVPRPTGEGIDGSLLSKDWKMSKNKLTKVLGDVPLGWIEPHMPYIALDMYRGRMISNPSMMFMLEQTDNPLLCLDITAWTLLAHITGDTPLPSPEEMETFSKEALLDTMNNPGVRYMSDKNYWKKWRMTALDDNHWSNNHSDHRIKDLNLREAELHYRFLARDALDSGYPLYLGTYEKLSEKGRALASFDVLSYYARLELDEDSPDASWRTFRDHDPLSYSIYTGKKSVPLKCRWSDIVGCKLTDIVAHAGEEEMLIGEQGCFGIKTKVKNSLAKLRSRKW